MTVETTINKSGPYAADSGPTFSYAFKIDADSDLTVTHVDALGAQTVLTLTTHYTVSGAGDANGGSITLTAGGISAYANAGETLTLERSVDLKQDRNLSGQASFDPAVHEAGFDKLHMIVQDLNDQLQRCIKAPAVDDPAAYADFEMGAASTRANAFLQFDANGRLTLVANVVPSSVTVSTWAENNLVSLASLAALRTLIGLGTAAYEDFGEDTVFVPASAMTPSASGGCSAFETTATSSGNPDINHLSFSNSGTQTAQFHLQLPKRWDGNDIKVQALWTGLTADAGDVEFEVSALAVGNDDAIDASFGTAVALSDTFIAAEDVHATPEGTLTVGGTPAEGDLIFFKVSRDNGIGSNRAAPANLLGLRIVFAVSGISDS